MALPHTLTVAGLCAMPESERYERIDGTLAVNPAPTWRHQFISSKLSFYLTADVMESQPGWVNSAAGVHVGDRTYAGPDVVFISRERVDIVGKVNVEAAPDLDCDILSPGTRRQDVITKRALSARIGV
jgi:Uma2 family endonuclease